MADVSFLKKHDRYKEFDAMDLQALGKAMQEKSFAGGKDVYQQDVEEEATSVYFVKSGTISLHKNVDGKERILGKIGEGEFLGETSLISPAPHTVTARADGDAVLSVLDQDGYAQLQEQAPATAFKVLDLFLTGLVLRLREADARLAEKFKAEPATAPQAAS